MSAKKKTQLKTKTKAKAPVHGSKPAAKAKAPAKHEPPKAAVKSPAHAAAPRAKAPQSAPASTAAPAAKPAAAPKPARKGRKSSLSLRRGPDGQPLQPGEILIPGGPKDADEVQYLLRGCVAAEHPNPGAGVDEIVAKRPAAEPDRPDLLRFAEGMAGRFESGSIESLLPTRPQARRNFLGVVERAKHRRREIGAFLRGLDLGRTETSHMDSHGEASLQSLMEWAARLENLVEADEPGQADYAQFHRGLDQLENTTEALILDVEQTLRRLRDRTRA
jgi:pyruvate/2-oxoglutarate dehydrogenase complex dihydrolipoamide acyltransferase (E2) component